MSEAARIQYLQEVLGVESLIAPVGALSTSVQPHSQKKSSRSLAVLVDKDPNSQEKALLHKMMAAIQVDDYRLLLNIDEEAESGSVPGIVFGPQALAYISDVEFSSQQSKWLQVGKKKWMVTHSLDSMITSQFPGDIKIYKKQVWQDLQTLQKELSE